MEYRVMTMDDYDSVRALWEGCAGVGLRSLDDSREGIAVYLDRNPATCFVAEEDGAVIGAVLSGHDGRRGYLYHLAVSPAHRRRGIGRGLVDKSVTALKDLGLTKMCLVVFADNQSGHKFWESVGFGRRTDLVHRDLVLDENNI